jgi:hypothetical protein
MTHITAHRHTDPVVDYRYRIEMRTHSFHRIFGIASILHSNKYLRNIIIGDSPEDIEIGGLLSS